MCLKSIWKTRRSVYTVIMTYSWNNVEIKENILVQFQSLTLYKLLHLHVHVWHHNAKAMSQIHNRKPKYWSFFTFLGEGGLSFWTSPNPSCNSVQWRYVQIQIPFQLNTPFNDFNIYDRVRMLLLPCCGKIYGNLFQNK